MNAESPAFEDLEDRRDVLTWQQSWYSVHTDGDWERSYGVEVGPSTTRAGP